MVGFPDRAIAATPDTMQDSWCGDESRLTVPLPFVGRYSTTSLRQFLQMYRSWWRLASSFVVDTSQKCLPEALFGHFPVCARLNGGPA